LRPTGKRRGVPSTQAYVARSTLVDERVAGRFPGRCGKEGDRVYRSPRGGAELRIGLFAVVDQVTLGDEDREEKNRVKNAPNHVIVSLYFNAGADILGLPF
jgi:hypothetical protein